MNGDFVALLKKELDAVKEQKELLEKQAQELKSELAERLREISEQHMRLDYRKRHLEALLEFEERPQARTDGEAREAAFTGVGLPLPGLMLNGSLADAAYEALKELGKECHYKELTRILQERGIVVPGKDPAINLVAHIHDDPRMVRPRRGVYGLREWYAPDMKSAGTHTNKGQKKRKKRATAAKGR